VTAREGACARGAEKASQRRQAQTHAAHFDHGLAVDGLLGLEHVRAHADVAGELNEPMKEHPPLRARTLRGVLDADHECASLL
jgi:hypothetical protein